MSNGTKHSLTLKDRGEHHRHRWLPQCACGHPFVPIRDKGRAADAYRAHVAAAQRAERAGQTIRKVKRSNPNQGRGRRTRTRQVGPRPLTPHDQLPPELQ